MKRRYGFWIVLTAYLFLSGCGKTELTGRVIDSDGRDIGNIKIMLYKASPEEPFVAVEETATDDKGIFNIKTGFTGDIVLEIAGNDGAGRILVERDEQETPLEIRYPVEEKIIFLHDNDLHFDFNSLEEFQTCIEKIRNGNDDVFLFNAGDISVRHPQRWTIDGVLRTDPAWYGERAAYMISTMNLLGYDLMTPGNHELAYIRPYTRAALETADFPIIAANIEVDTDGMVPLEAFRILHTSTLRTVAVLGLSRTSLPADSTGIVMLDPFDTAARYIYLADENDVFIALTHIGYKDDVKLAERFPRFDVIIGGHSHTMLENAETVNTVLVAQTGGSEHVMSKDHVKYLGEVDVTLLNGEIVEKTGHVIALPLP